MTHAMSASRLQSSAKVAHGVALSWRDAHMSSPPEGDAVGRLHSLKLEPARALLGEARSLGAHRRPGRSARRPPWASLLRPTCTSGLNISGREPMCTVENLHHTSPPCLPHQRMTAGLLELMAKRLMQ